MKDKTYTITKSLSVAESDGKETDYLGCTATVMHELPHSVAVKFYGGLPVLISKPAFKKSAKEIKEEEMIKYHEIYEVSLYIDNTFIKRFRTIFFEGDDIQQKAKAIIQKLYKLQYNKDYNLINTSFIESIGEKIMSKKEEATTIEIGEEVKDTKAVIPFEEAVKKIYLPEIPNSFILGGVEISTAAIKKKSAEVLKIKLADEKDKATYERLKKHASELTKTRTSTKKFREDTSKKVNAWNKNFKKIVQDDIEEALKPAEDHCAAQIKIYTDYEAEQLRLEEERKEKQVQDRRVLLQAVGGDMNIASFSWTFKHHAALIENSDLEEWADVEFDTLHQELQASYQAQLKKEQEAKEDADKTKTLFINTRKQMLQLMGYTLEGNEYLKNGHRLPETAVATLSEDGWMEMLTMHNTPVEQAPSPFAKAQTAPAPASASAPTQSTGGGFNPFGSKPVQPVPVAQSEPTAFGGTVSQEAKEVTREEALAVLFEGIDHVEFALTNTTVRLFPTSSKEKALEGVQPVFQGDFSNDLSFTIYKNV